MREKRIENALRLAIMRRDGVAFKFTSPGTDGVPDRLVCLPGGRMYLVETKAPKGVLNPVQKIVKGILGRMSIPVYVIHTLEELNNFLKTIDTDDL